MTVRITIEIVADERRDALSLLAVLRDELDRGRERSGEMVSFCMGDYRVTLEDEPIPEPAFSKGDRVRVLSEPYANRVGVVKHCGAYQAGVAWLDSPDVAIVSVTNLAKLEAPEVP